jgi:hypothetical protein
MVVAAHHLRQQFRAVGYGHGEFAVAAQHVEPALRVADHPAGQPGAHGDEQPAHGLSSAHAAGCAVRPTPIAPCTTQKLRVFFQTCMRNFQGSSPAHCSGSSDAHSEITAAGIADELRDQPPSERPISEYSLGSSFADELIGVRDTRQQRQNLAVTRRRESPRAANGRRSANGSLTITAVFLAVARLQLQARVRRR